MLMEQDAPLFAGYQGYLADPDGHLWDIVYNPGLAVTCRRNRSVIEHISPNAS